MGTLLVIYPGGHVARGPHVAHTLGAHEASAVAHRVTFIAPKSLSHASQPTVSMAVEFMVSVGAQLTCQDLEAVLEQGACLWFSAPCAQELALVVPSS